MAAVRLRKVMLVEYACRVKEVDGVEREMVRKE
jgi:hypothetical protein